MVRLRSYELAFLDQGNVLVITRDPRYRIVLIWKPRPKPPPPKPPDLCCGICGSVWHSTKDHPR